jgi:gliding motility-associated-like protein
MKVNLIVLGIFLSLANALAQEALQNFGNLKIHNQGSVGFHHDFINNGITDDNFGTAGFFSDNSINILGAFRPVFNDMEIMVANDLFLEVGVRVKNNTNYILGDVVTPRNQTDVNLDYLDNTFYIGNDNLRKIDGFSSLTNKQEFTFPIGDDDRLRSLRIFATEVIPNAKSAYFFEDPNTPSDLSNNYYTAQKADDVESVSTYEFWYLDGMIPARVHVTWDEQSNLSDFVDDLENLKVVGWHTQNQQWENLGGTTISGDFNSGEITSEIFLANDYSILTFGSSSKSILMTLDNYILTPNGDGVNDFLVIDEIERSPNNTLKIFNRWGRLVYSKDDYANTFYGKANVDMVIQKELSLPDGIYFYIIDLEDLNLKFQGYLYLIE